MAAVSELITLGIGTPATIAHLVLVGLSPTGVVAIIAAVADVTIHVRPEATTIQVRPDVTTIYVRPEPTTVQV